MSTIPAIRYENLAKLLEKSGLTQKAYAAKIKTAENYLYQLLESKGQDGGRGMGSPVARKIEIAEGLPRGWMDVEHADRSVAAPESSAAIFEQLRTHVMTLTDVLARSIPGLAVALANRTRPHLPPGGGSDNLPAIVLDILQAAIDDTRRTTTQPSADHPSSKQTPVT